ncbi:MAG: hypothetical protein ACJ8R9_21975 [Steroidobacteraceae bacterium]
MGTLTLQLTKEEELILARRSRKAGMKRAAYVRKLIVADDSISQEWSVVMARPPVLPPAARAYARKIEGNRELAIRFLKEAGIIEKPGKLARPYR